MVSGDLGIGTTNPIKALEINDPNGDCLRLTYNDDDGLAGNFVDFSVSSDGKLTIYAEGTGTLEDIELNSQGFDNAVYIDDSANTVGIGLSSPLTKLHVAGDVAFGAGSGLTMSNDEITVTHSYHTINAETGNSDNLDTISGHDVAGQILIITVASGDSITVIDDDGNIKLQGNDNDFTIDDEEDTLTLIYDGSNWIEFSRSVNS